MPQEASLSPLLFDAFVMTDDITDQMSEDIKVSLFADDLALQYTDKSIASAEEKVLKSFYVLEQLAKE